MFCQQCGTEINTSKKFCTNCGWKIEVSEVKEEVKKVVKKEPAKKEIKTEKKEISTSNKSLQKKYGPFFGKLSSNLKKESVTSEVKKNDFERKKQQKVISEVEKNKALENQGKGFSKPLFGVSFLAIIGTLIFITERERKAEIKRPSEGKEYSYINQYLKSDGNCCNEKLSSGLFLEKKVEVLNDIISRNPKDTEALLQRANTNEIEGNYVARCIDLSKATILGNGLAKSKFYEELYSNDNPYEDWKRVWKGCHIEKSSKYLVSKFKDREWKKFGIYSVFMKSVSLDLDHFKKYQDLVYEAEVRRNGEILDYNYSFDCSSRKKYDWESEEWIKPTSSYEKSMIDAMCFSRGADPRVTKTLEKIGWEKVYKVGWVDVNNWESFKEDEFNYYETVFYDEPSLYMSKLAVACNPLGISYKYGGEWDDFRSPKGQERNLVNEKCNQALSSSSETPWSIEDIYSLVGGETKYNKLVEWASYNLSENEIDKFDKIMDSGDYNLVKTAVLKLKEKRDSN